MGRIRKYESAAARKAAQRERDKAAWVQVQRAGWEALHLRLDALQRAVVVAARRGDATAQECQAASVETLLDQLIEHFEKVE
jgi:hypothetical protein